MRALSVRRLADELGVSRQVVYTHFHGMNGVLDALHVRSGHRLVEDVQRLTGDAGTDERVVEAAHAYVRAARDRPGLFELTFARPIPTYRASADTTTELRRVFSEHIVGLVREWLGAHDLHEVDPVQAARIFWSGVHGLVTLERAGHARPDETDSLVDDTVRTLLAGWRSTSPG